MEEGQNRRKYVRVPLSEAAPTVFLSVRVLYQDHDTVGRIVNIAEEGIFLQTEVPIPIGVPVSLRFVLASGRLCRADGNAVWKPESGVGVGIRLAPDDEFRMYVRQLASAESAKELLQLIRDVREADLRFSDPD